MARARKGWLEWFRVDRDLLEHPKFNTLKTEWAVDRDVAAGRLIRFWSWVARHAPMGNLNAEACRAVEECCGFPLTACIRAGFVESLEEHEGLVTKARAHHWYRMNGSQLRERYRKRRNSAESPRNNPSVSAHTERDGTESKANQTKPVVQPSSPVVPSSPPSSAPALAPSRRPPPGNLAPEIERQLAALRERKDLWEPKP